MTTRDLLVLAGAGLWLSVVFIRIYPLSHRLRREFGFDKGHPFFSQKAREGHPVAQKLIRESRVMLVVGVAGALAIALSK